MKTLWLNVPYPPSGNRYWRTDRGGTPHPSDEGRAYKAAVRRVVRPMPFVGEVSVSVTLLRPRRAGDLDNSLKVLLDALTGLAWLDDGQIRVIHAERIDGDDAPRAKVTVEGDDFATPEQIREHAEKVAAAKKKRRKTLRQNRALKATARLIPNVIRERR